MQGSYYAPLVEALMTNQGGQQQGIGPVGSSVGGGGGAGFANFGGGQSFMGGGMAPGREFAGAQKKKGLGEQDLASILQMMMGQQGGLQGSGMTPGVEKKGGFMSGFGAGMGAGGGGGGGMMSSREFKEDIRPLSIVEYVGALQERRRARR
jgi:hypothetical protein